MAGTSTSSFPSTPITLRYPLGETVVPGDRLGTLAQVQAGTGTHVQGRHIYASLVGTLRVDPITTTTPTLYSCWVEPAAASKPPASARVLQVGQLILGTVTRITPQNALVDIVLVEGVGSPGTPLEGAIRMEDVRAGGTTVAVSDSQQRQQQDGEGGWSMDDCFQPGDVVACRIVSLGDTRRYFLSTAETELGVLCARCKRSGAVMIPISWKEMQCPETGMKELRKCAKPGGGLVSNEPA